MSDNNAPFNLSTVKIPSKTSGWNLDAWKYVPIKHKGKAGPHPVIVMAHGFSANKKMSLTPYAEAFTALGYACVVFDYRRFGDSDGTPRECIYVSEQLDDYRTVIGWVKKQEEFDAQRVVLWGTSFAGAHAITLAVEKDLKLTCAITQCPYVGSAPKPSFTVFLKLVGYGIVDLLRQALGREPLYIPVAGAPGTVAGLTTPDSVDGFKQIARDKRDYPNRISASSMFELPFYKPSAKASKIACPVLLILAETDELCLLEYSLSVARSSDKFVTERTPGGHFDLYPDGPDHEQSLKAQVAFLQKQVPV
ncbi:alpha/beta-hydrolase [Fomitiporia mediterranea MF3/22]|uniref:alpha/beta-hydrolase n=1 Tax=Fomitiporia mediterranea (strain MF3/22) TaxID=694068 RepID=UPI0004408DAE|nr:alpha/beta-hydrolase [Fomitiporia mediterranea MF3/22]EJD06525.1 alpha/beta-hydrolase [Fomitiporia mediterranea MF3/22]